MHNHWQQNTTKTLLKVNKCGDHEKITLQWFHAIQKKYSLLCAKMWKDKT